MAYNHSRKAGNPGDVWKHFVLVELANTIIKESEPFRYAESHCGAPVHKLTDSGEWRNGIGRIFENVKCDSRYVSVAREWLKTKQYPAGWVFMACQLADRFAKVEISLFDTDEEVAATYPPAGDAGIPGNVLIEFSRENGYAAVEKLPAPDLVFLDPPFHPDAEADWRALADACVRLESKGIDFVAWYPFYSHTKPQELSNKTRASAREVHWEPCGARPGPNLKGCGMLVSDSLLQGMQALQTKFSKMAECMHSKLVIRQPVE